LALGNHSSVESLIVWLVIWWASLRPNVKVGVFGNPECVIPDKSESASYE
jgi:hypothetical protein